RTEQGVRRRGALQVLARKQVRPRLVAALIAPPTHAGPGPAEKGPNSGRTATGVAAEKLAAVGPENAVTHERLEHARARPGIEIEQARCLRNGEAHAGHFEIFGTNAYMQRRFGVAIHQH